MPGDIAASDGATPAVAPPAPPWPAMGAQPPVPTTPIAASLVQGFDPGGGIAGSLVPASPGRTFVVGTGPANGTLWGIAGQVDSANRQAQMASLAQNNGLRVDPVTGAVNIHPGQVLSVPDLSAADPATLAGLARSGGALTAASQQARDANAARTPRQAAAPGLFSGLITDLPVGGPGTVPTALPPQPGYLATLLALPTSSRGPVPSAPAQPNPNSGTVIQPLSNAYVHSSTGKFDVTLAGPDLPNYPYDQAESGVYRPDTTERAAEAVPAIGEIDVSAYNTSVPPRSPFRNPMLDWLFRDRPASVGRLTEFGGTLHIVDPSGGGDYMILNHSPLEQEGEAIRVRPAQ